MLEYLSIEGAQRLEGSVRVSGAKNSALPLLIATLLTSERCVLRNVPDLEDIAVTLRLLRSLGSEADFADNEVVLQTQNIEETEARYGLVKALRASFWVLGPLLARVGEARVALPGGDAIGTRPVDIHLKGLAKMGAEIRMDHGAVIAQAPGGLYAEEVELDYPSVGATHHILMTAALVPGETVIHGAAREPEVVQLAQFLSAMGAEVDGAGTSTIRIVGKRELSGADVDVAGDRIEGATYLVAGAVRGGVVTVDGLPGSYLRATLDVLREAGCGIEESETGITIEGASTLKPISFATAPFPGVATDVQPLLMAAMCCADGISVITETVFENRFGHVAEYRRLGAEIELDGRIARVSGGSQLSSAPVEAGDIRAAAGLVLMGLFADGCTELHEPHHLDRGYELLIDKFRSLGANIRRTPAFDEKEVVLGC